jgi:DNA-binding protein HU-beta
MSGAAAPNMASDPNDERFSMSVNRTELVAAIAERASLTKTDADAALSALQDVLVDALSKGEAVKVTGLLSVERVERAARTGRNPRTGEEIQIPAGYGVKISAGSTLKKAVAK